MAGFPGNAFAATWFDGHTAAAHPVHVVLASGALTLHANDGGVIGSVPLDRLDLSEPTRRGPRFVYFDDRSTLEVHDAAPFNATLEQLGSRPTGVARLQRSAPAATAALVSLVATFIFGYVVGVPWAARWVAFALPESVEIRLGEQFARTLELQVLAPSDLPPGRQEELVALLDRAAARGAPGVRYALALRDVRDGEGRNAFTLPGGTIILLDGLVEAAGDDRQILAVLGHELGHAAHKHGLRNVLQALSIAAVASAMWGDFAGAAANVPVVFGALHYSREFELEADAFAVGFLRANGMDAQPLIDFFEMIDGRKGQAHGIADFLSTHPHTADRIERLKRMP